MDTATKQQILEIVYGLVNDQSGSDSRSDLILQFIESSPENQRITESAADEISDGDPLAMLRSDSPECGKFRLSFGNWLGERGIWFPGAAEIRCRSAPWRGVIGVNANGQVTQVIAG